MKNTGIYLITCKLPGRVLPLYYVGQSLDIRRRIGQHRNALDAGCHYNRKLQFHWAKYGGQCFVFEILELCSMSNLDEIEAWWLSQMVGHRRCFNIGIDPAAPMRGRKFSADHKKKIADAIRGAKHYAFGKSLSLEHRAAISASGKGLRRSSETRVKISSANTGSKNSMYGQVGAKNKKSRPVEGSDPVTGSTVYFESGNLAEAHGYRQDSISRACNGLIKTHKGLVWRFTDHQDPV